MKASDILTQIKEVLGMELSEVEVKFEEKKLENGTKIEAEAFEKGKSVFIKSEDDEKLALPVGEYTLEDGTLLVVEEEGKISEMKKMDDKDYKDEDEDEKKDMDEEADVADWKGMEKRIKNLEDAIADLKGDKEDKNEKEVVEETEDEEVYIVEIEGVEYYTYDDMNGDILKIMDDEDLGEKVGEFKNGKAVMTLKV